MAGNKRPRRKYNPNKNRGQNVHVSYASTAQVFAPVIRALESLRTEVTLVDDVPMVEDWQGDLIPIAPLLREWSVWFERIGLDCVPLRALADRLDSGADLYESEVVAAEKAINAQINAFANMRVRDVRAVNLTHQIALEMNRLGIGD